MITSTRQAPALGSVLVATVAIVSPVDAVRGLEDALAYDRLTELSGVSLNRDATRLYAAIEPWQGRLEIVRYDLDSSEALPQSLVAPPCIEVKGLLADRQEEHVVFTCDPLGDERHKLHIVDIGTGAQLLPTPRDQFDIPCAFSLDGAVLYATRGRHIWGATRIVEISTSTGEARTLFAREDARLFCHDISDDGNRLLIERYIDNGEGHLGIVELRGGDIEWLLREQEVQVRAAQFAGETVRFIANRRDGQFRLWNWGRVSGLRAVELPVSGDLDGFQQNNAGLLALSYHNGLLPVSELYRQRGEAKLQPVPLGAEPDQISMVVLARNSADRAAIITEQGRPPRLSIAERGRTRLLLDTNQTGLPDSAFARYQSQKIKSFDGTEIPTHILVPSSATPGSPLPLLLLVHGGPDEHVDPQYASGLQRLANAGFVVVQPNVRGSTGFGRAFADMDNGDWGGAHIRDLLAVAESVAGLDVVAERPRFICGDSFGGFSVLSTITQYPSAFDGAVESFGIADLETFFRGLPDQVRPQLIRELGFDPTRHPERARAISPLHQLDRIVTPLQIHQGIHDPRVPVEQSRRLIAALAERGIPVQYFEYDEGHGFARGEDRVLYRERVIAFLRALSSMPREHPIMEPGYRRPRSGSQAEP
jgi:protease II